MQRFPLTAAVAATLVLAGCAGGMHTRVAGQVEGPNATAQLEPTRGNLTRGMVHFTQMGDTVRVQGEILGLAPHSEHGFHVHEKGDCSSGDGSSAGGHFNPHNTRHGMAMGAEHHTGDLPSLNADAKGVARIDVKISGIRVGSGMDDIVGRGLIVHRDRDDFTSQPSGNAGPRLACAVIRRK
jgi:Cu-Zn family superoxide dismutase